MLYRRRSSTNKQKQQQRRRRSSSSRKGRVYFDFDASSRFMYDNDYNDIPNRELWYTNGDYYKFHLEDKMAKEKEEEEAKKRNDDRKSVGALDRRKELIKHLLAMQMESSKSEFNRNREIDKLVQPGSRFAALMSYQKAIELAIELGSPILPSTMMTSNRTAGGATATVASSGDTTTDGLRGVLITKSSFKSSSPTNNKEQKRNTNPKLMSRSLWSRLRGPPLTSPSA